MIFINKKIINKKYKIIIIIYISIFLYFLYNIIMNNFFSIVEKYIKKLYKNTSAYGSIDTELSKHNPTTYGEILPSSVTTIINLLKVKPNDVFYDLGSGSGKVVTQFFLQTKAKKNTGIELVPFRHNIAIQIKNKLQKTFPDKFISQQLQFINGDILTQDLTDATIIYMCSTCFSNELLQKITNKLNESNNLRTIITLKELPTLHKKLKNKQIIKTPCTWSTDTIAYIYT
jgi:precorrin-6B methylase 2